MSKSRHWCFTLNNYTDETIILLNELRCNYITYQPERGASGTAHLQGFVSFANPRALGGVRSLCPGWHVEAMRGTAEQAIAYCHKDDSRDADAGFGIYERGDKPLSAGLPGGRSDLQRIGELVRDGKRGREIFDSDPGAYIRFHRGISAAVQLVSPCREFKTVVHWYYGPTGTGKSRAACAEAPGAYWKSASDSWWDGYEGHDDVIVDDYRPDFCKFSHLLRLFDRYPLRLQVKGGTVEFVAKRIFITAPKRPDEIWENRSEEDIGQLLRRIEVIKLFDSHDFNPLHN